MQDKEIYKNIYKELSYTNNLIKKEIFWSGIGNGVNYK